MKRNISALCSQAYDLVVVGGGIFGACAAWNAALRGLSVALLEKGDFCRGTSANSFRMIHGGIRYLQHADFVRIRRSVKERRSFLMNAPHLTRPLPIAIPLYGHGLKGKEILRAGFMFYDLFAFDRNRGVRDPERHVPRGSFLGREETRRRFPGLEQQGLTGAALFYDGQVHSLPRLVLACLCSAVRAGAKAANHVEVTGFLMNGRDVTGVSARDALTGECLSIRAGMVLNAAGPWAERLLQHCANLQLSPRGSYTRDACFIVPRRLTGGPFALAVQASTRDPGALISRQNRHLFVVPWRQEYTLVGVWHKTYDGDPEDCTVTREELQSYLDEINRAYPGLSLSLKDISMWNAGLVPSGDNDPGAENIKYGKKSRLIDHSDSHETGGLITLIGARYTTARGDAARAIDLVFKKLQRPVPGAVPEKSPVWGGCFERFTDLLGRAVRQNQRGLNAGTLQRLVQNYGTEYRAVFKYIEQNPALAEPLNGSSITKAEVVHAVRTEMACRLSDTVLRRTDLAAGKAPGRAALQACAQVMADELEWDEARVQSELAEVRAELQKTCLLPPA